MDPFREFVRKCHADTCAREVAMSVLFPPLFHSNWSYFQLECHTSVIVALFHDITQLGAIWYSDPEQMLFNVIPTF